MEYARHAEESPDGTLFDAGTLTLRLVDLAGDRSANAADELLYVLSGEGRATIDARGHALRPGVALSVPAGTAWSAAGEGRAVSVLVTDPGPGTGAAVADLAEVERSAATAGRQFLLGAACASATQFVGLIPPGRAPDHFHRYDEVIYVLEGEGELAIGGETAPLRPGSCVHLPRTLVHCLANTGETELRVLGVFRPAGSPAEAYYPDGTPAAVPDE